MPKANSALVWLAFVVCFALAMIAVVMIGKRVESRWQPPQPPEVVYIYTVRGVIDSLPETGRPASEFRVMHEPIDDYKDKDGIIVGMGTMVMGFGIPDNEFLDGFAIGDKVEFTWEVRPRTFPKDIIVDMTKLPPDAQMRFGKAATEDEPPTPPAPEDAEETGG